MVALMAFGYQCFSPWKEPGRMSSLDFPFMCFMTRHFLNFRTNKVWKWIQCHGKGLYKYMRKCLKSLESIFGLVGIFLLSQRTALKVWDHLDNAQKLWGEEERYKPKSDILPSFLGHEIWLLPYCPWVLYYFSPSQENVFHVSFISYTIHSQ